jgi:hypothetical protein
MKHVAIFLALVLPGAVSAQTAENAWMLYTSAEKTRAITSSYAPRLLTEDVCIGLGKAFLAADIQRQAHCMNAVTGEFINVEEIDQ